MIEDASDRAAGAFFRFDRYSVFNAVFVDTLLEQVGNLRREVFLERGLLLHNATCVRVSTLRIERYVRDVLSMFERGCGISQFAV